MKYNFLGNTGLLVSEICFGTMTFGGKGLYEAIGKAQQQDVNSIMKTVVDSGINFIDTANVYSFGESETLLGQSIKDVGLDRDQLIIATKVRAFLNQGKNSGGLSRYHIFQSVDASLKRLQLNHVDILYVHGVDLHTPVEEIMRSLNDIVLSGKVRYVAVCNWPGWMVMKGMGIAEKYGWHKFVGMQYFYSLAGRDIEREVLPVAADQNLAMMPWSPLAGGFLSGKFTRDNQNADGARRSSFDFPLINKEKAYDIIDVIAGIGKQYGVSAAQIALAWVRLQKGVTSTIIGAKNADQLLDNIRSTDIELSADDLQKMDEVSALPVEYPGWIIEYQNKNR
ncbi:aldo/keto reductase [Mucilaginibacter pocheonensis]|uniref:Aryl-alcohol dehydrogenase-like predicted oxidoreductase n=1 Tax=Mucilaginibacter pocheonensis TaxID=398050 RepID=A0ABU1TGR4_9SPHI|nr:aldo/keto reductase [Mucilaginibacter pocheonensis]MDR6944578.1 aryl-alcohol dehydrogenase-like predicted oxidoreductase [Mucilaginibacter pocheonensis]